MAPLAFETVSLNVLLSSAPPAIKLPVRRVDRHRFLPEHGAVADAALAAFGVKRRHQIDVNAGCEIRSRER